MVDESIVKNIKTFLREVVDSGIDVSFAVLYGSQIKGTSRSDSDIDLIVVSPLFDIRREWSDERILWRLAGQIDSRIEPIACGERQWREDDASPIIEIARREGQLVYVDHASESHSTAPAV